MSRDYKDTLNLPNTKFPMKANLPFREPNIIKEWNNLNIYKTLQKNRKGKEQFILNDGPPYANGDIHIGHAFNKILKDLVLKSQRLLDKDVPYVPGWDCHGLPIELQVEKKYGKPGVKISKTEFRQKCREYAQNQVETQKASFERLGIFGDWDNPYKTMDYKFEADIIRTLGKIIDKNHLSSGDRPVHWCIDCGSALAEAEVEYKDKTSESIYVKFKLNDLDMLKAFDYKSSDKNVYVIIWTTTPWTLPANQAVAVNPDLDYVLFEYNKNKYIVAKDLLETVVNVLEISEEYKLLSEAKGENLENYKLQHPLYNREVPIIFGEHVTVDAGTGCVHTAPAHGYDDYLVGQKYDLVVESPVAANGCFNDNVEIVAGQHISKANKTIIEFLENNKNLLLHKKLEHSYPHCWRHKTPLIFRATKQWFISMDKENLRQKSLREIENVKWIPDWGQARITKMLENRPDWCVSRQRTWGTPMPLFVHKETRELHPNTVELINKVADLVEEKGIDAWFDLDAAKILQADADNYEKVSDTLDVWFDSGSVHECVLQQRTELSFPADLYLEGSDQHRGWFQSSLLTSVSINEKAPYKHVLTHGFVLDPKGQKMSKSLGNIIAPDKVIKTLGADVLRLWVAATDYRNDVHISNEILTRISDSYRRLRNTLRFLLSNLNGFELEKSVEFKNMLALDQWIVKKAIDLQELVIKEYNNYQFHLVYQAIHGFCVNELGSFYLDVIKDRQYTCLKNGNPRLSAQSALYQVAEILIRAISPILSFTAEDAWSFMPFREEQSVFFATWQEHDIEQIKSLKKDDKFWQEILILKNAVNKVLENSRKEGHIGSGLEAELKIYLDETKYKLVSELEDELKFVLITSQAHIFKLEEKNDKAVATELEGVFVLVEKTKHKKCERCWHRTEDVDQNLNFPDICQRCAENLYEPGEKRLYA